jgi:CheY-like chemotaxis protein
VIDQRKKVESDVDDGRMLSRRLAVALSLPLVLLVAVGLVLRAQVSRMRQDSAWVDHTDRVIGAALSAQKKLADQESGFRGFLITRDRNMLADAASEGALRDLQLLLSLTTDSVEQQARLRDVRRDYLDWRAQFDQGVERPDLALTPATLKERRANMERLRAGLEAVIEFERRLRVDRTERLATSGKLTDIGLVVLLGFAGVVIAMISRSQLAHVRKTYASALADERAARLATDIETRIRSALMEVSRATEGELPIDDLAARVLSLFAKRTGAEAGVMYLAEAGGNLRRLAAHALSAGSVPEEVKRGEGVVGQVAADGELKVLSGLEPGYLRLESGTGGQVLPQVVLAPLRDEGRTIAVLELGFLRPPEAEHLDLLGRASNIVAVGLRSAQYRDRLRELLARTQEQASELQSQQDELLQQNEELEEQGRALQEAQRNLEVQQAELQQSNEHLQEQSRQLEAQNEQLLAAQAEIATKAAEISKANQYKSEFLANMSHELRTPLNSSLILAKLLADNPQGNLSPEQVKFASTIYSAGNDLLALINDILDLSKIEAGHMGVHLEPVSLARFVEGLKATFEPVGRVKGVGFEVLLEHAEEIRTDQQKLQQVLNNLLSNAFKFTERGQVELRVGCPDGDTCRFEVKDSGIGIPKDKQQVIFDAFRQADGTTARRYGGTGLGLAISRDLARLLGGDIEVESDGQHGSTFVLTLPRRPAESLHEQSGSSPPPSVRARTLTPIPYRSVKRGVPAVNGNGNGNGNGKPTNGKPANGSSRRVLIIEDDPGFAQAMSSLAGELSFSPTVAGTASDGLRLASELLPSAIVLDMHLPDALGLSVLDQLKRNRETRHIPVHVVSVADHSQLALEMGAVGYLRKPATREDLTGALRRLEATFTRDVRRVLVVEDDETQREAICHLLEGSRVETAAVGSVHAALDALRSQTFDCVVTDLMLPDASGQDFLETLASDEQYAFPPIVVYTGRNLTSEEEQRLRRFSSSIIVKGVRSPERLLDEVTLFLHQVESELPPERQRMLRQARDREAAFEGKRVLVVEDDVRNVFALTNLLEPKGVEVSIARNGVEALAALEQGPDMDLVLMDMMMPEMDGLEATRRIRSDPKLRRLPVIMLTAKAMQDDREKCLAAGANDYASKPLDVDMLLSLMRVWMPR